MNHTDNANIFKALGDENRLKILELLLDGEKCGSELLEQFSMGQSTLSHHLKMMLSSGIVKSRKVKTATYYSINPDGAKNAVEILCEITGIEKCSASADSSAQEEESRKPAVRQTGSRPNGWLL